MQSVNESGHTLLRVHNRTTSEYGKSMPLLRILLHAHITLLQILEFLLTSAPKALREMMLEEFPLEPTPRYSFTRIFLFVIRLL
jgi:hypothetical protein